jgi:hypothetical protein
LTERIDMKILRERPRPRNPVNVSALMPTFGTS